MVLVTVTLSIVVDGVVTDYFPSFSQDEVESITILKDATAAAVYGVRAAAGVILVTTKRGTVQKPTVTVNSSVTLSQNTNFPEFLNGPILRIGTIQHSVWME